jgi:hypothetical protein
MRMVQSMPMTAHKQTVLVHLASGIGNIVFTTPLLVALNHMEFIVDVLIHADHPQTADLLRDWSIVRTVYTECPQRINYSYYDFIGSSGSRVGVFGPF